jgi:molybdopterin-guanine dinucleotide biosynthesis protein A
VTSRELAPRFDGMDVVLDEVADQGPLRALASGLAASSSEINLVIACDIPRLDPDTAAVLLSKIDSHDIV